MKMLAHRQPCWWPCYAAVFLVPGSPPFARALSPVSTGVSGTSLSLLLPGRPPCRLSRLRQGSGDQPPGVDVLAGIRVQNANAYRTATCRTAWGGAGYSARGHPLSRNIIKGNAGRVPVTDGDLTLRNDLAVDLSSVPSLALMAVYVGVVCPLGCTLDWIETACRQWFSGMLARRHAKACAEHAT